jgi:putative flippase GtrA
MRRVVPLQLFRFGVVTVLGFGIDVSLAWALAVAGTPLPFATLGGFLAAAAFNYVLHELWTFATDEPRAFAHRRLLYLAGLGLTLATRLLVVFGLSRLRPHGAIWDLLVLMIAIGCSFAVNYTLSKHIVFRTRPLAVACTRVNTTREHRE